MTYPDETVEGIAEVHGRKSICRCRHLVEQIPKNLWILVSFSALAALQNVLDCSANEKPVVDCPFLCNDVLGEESSEFVLALLEVLFCWGGFRNAKIFGDHLVNYG